MLWAPTREPKAGRGRLRKLNMTRLWQKRPRSATCHCRFSRLARCSSTVPGSHPWPSSSIYQDLHPTSTRPLRVRLTTSQPQAIATPQATQVITSDDGMLKRYSICASDVQNLGRTLGDLRRRVLGSRVSLQTPSAIGAAHSAQIEVSR